jgi:hypothetical protein
VTRRNGASWNEEAQDPSPLLDASRYVTVYASTDVDLVDGVHGVPTAAGKGPVGLESEHQLLRAARR